jgi:predicted GIY-YIG superfamily endonuclease
MSDSLQEFADDVADNSDGTVYLIHFNEKLAHAQHYMGWTTNLQERLHAHETGNGSRLMEVVNDAGITWQLARTWAGGRDLERKLKAQKNGPRFCPICSKGGD